MENLIFYTVEGPGNPGKVMYLPHQTVMREDHSPAKSPVVFDASAKKVGPSSNNV